ncbi:hypothetical protein ABW21_db0208182 [Orbilia brochopaga]|nr:hypothetical protein ABW21_db0208182 [Drechslerella brochopaga]
MTAANVNPPVRFSFVPPVDEHDVRSLRRPMLVHLNADTTWLLLLPRRDGDGGKRKFYRILIDPWLAGAQAEISGWISEQEHKIKSCVESIDGLVDAIRTFEGMGKEDVEDAEGPIDAVIVSHEFTDHCHQETLMQVSSNVPVFAAGKPAVDMVRSWKHFTTVVEAPTGADGEGVQMFDGVKVQRIESTGDAPPTFHCAVIISCSFDGDEGKLECIVYTPHGIFPAALEALSTAPSSTATASTATGSSNEGVDGCQWRYGRPLALIHGLHDIRLGFAPYGGLSVRLNLGGPNAAACMRACRGVGYWIGTHDERKIERGAVSYMTWRHGYTVHEVQDADGEMRERYVEVGNGEGVVL